MKQVQRGDDVPEDLVEYVLRHGKEYIPAVRPNDLSIGQLGMCFDQSMLNAIKGKYRYVEGIAQHPHESYRWMIHAWVTDGVYVFDPTWRRVDRATKKEVPLSMIKYVGIEMDVRKVAQFMGETEYMSVLANGWRLPEVVKEIMPEGRVFDYEFLD